MLEIVYVINYYMSMIIDSIRFELDLNIQLTILTLELNEKTNINNRREII